MLASLVIFMPAFSAMKSAIPLFNPFSWDGVWISTDQAIFGTDAWRFFQPLLGFPIVTSALSLAYVLWFFLIYAGSVYFCFLARDRELRARYFVAYFALWMVCGVCLAVLFSSVGPCFVGPLLGDHRFDEQMTYLRAVPEASLDLVLAADVFIYFHELMQVGPPAARALKAGGLIAFSVETHDGDGVILRDTLRYAHSEPHVREAMAAGGLELLMVEQAWARREKGDEVPGLVVVARR